MARRLIIPMFLTILASPIVSLHAQTTSASQAGPCPAQATPEQTSSESAQKKRAARKSDQAPAAGADTPCASPVREPSAAEKFPFPGSSSAPTMGGTPPSTPDAPTPSDHPKSAAEEHPFPGSAPPMPGSEPSASSSSDGYSSSNGASGSPDTPDAAKDETKPGPAKDLGRRRLPKVEKLQSDEDRVYEDIKVAKFYEGKGDLNAAYLRLRDAVKSLPNDSESHFALARMAQKMDKRDEAIAEYNTYLKLEPDGENVRKANKALELLTSR